MTHTCCLALLSLAALLGACSGTVLHQARDGAAVGDGAVDGSSADDGAPGPDGAGPDAPPEVPDAGSTAVTFTPAALDPATELTNPLRGQYLWLGQPPYPSGRTDVDSYERWNWADFESAAGVYDWQLIDDALAAARQRKGRFGMRLMPLCQGCGHHQVNGAWSSIPDDLAAVANPLVGAAPGESEQYVLPDWNSAAYLDRLETTLDAIGARYRDDPTFGWVDVSAYGNWGEFHLYPFNQSGGPYDSSTQQPITDANARRIVQMNAAAFPTKLLVLNSENVAADTEAAATVAPPIGFRVDCLGADELGGGQWPLEQATGALEHWRVAPFITEWCQYNIGGSGADLFIQGEQQVRDFHISMLSSGNFSSPPTAGAEQDAFRAANCEAGYRLRPASLHLVIDAGRATARVVAEWANDGVAPTYLAWRVVLGLRGESSVELPLATDLRQAMPDAPLAADESVAMGAALTPGTYTVFVRVDDVQQVSPPLALALSGRGADGAYDLGTITLP
jgi:hypothetical protein